MPRYSERPLGAAIRHVDSFACAIARVGVAGCLFQIVSE
jgi:hypothetical protein